jgi:hypothetical protein
VCRPKITKQLGEFLTSFPPVIKHPVACTTKVLTSYFSSVPLLFYPMSVYLQEFFLAAKAGF